MGQQLNRKDLYDLVWSEPMTKLAERFGISSVALAKHCQKMQVPTPARGFWARKAAGKSVIKVRLPPRPLGFDDATVIGGGAYANYYYRPSREDILGPVPPEPKFDELMEVVQARVETAIKKAPVARHLDQPHSVVAKLLSLDDARREKQRASSYISMFESPRYDSPIQRRRLRILSAILLATSAFGCRSETVRSEPYGKPLDDFVIIVGHQRVSLRASVVEVRRRSGKGTDMKVTKEDNLRIALDPGDDRHPDGRTWEDGQSSLEHQARDIAVAIVVKGEQQCRESALRAHRWRIKQKDNLIEEMRKEKEEAERKEKERRAELERKRVERLLSEASAFRKAQEIRMYVADVRAANQNSPNPLGQLELDAWAAWALRQADEIDPVRNWTLTGSWLALPTQ